MNSKNAKAFLPLVQALADGKTIQGRDEVNGWFDLDMANISFYEPLEFYRIKPEPREFWINFYGDGAFATHTSKEHADGYTHQRTECIYVREVI